MLTRTLYDLGVFRFCGICSRSNFVAAFWAVRCSGSFQMLLLVCLLGLGFLFGFHLCVWFVLGWVFWLSRLFRFYFCLVNSIFRIPALLIAPLKVMVNLMFFFFPILHCIHQRKGKKKCFNYWDAWDLENYVLLIFLLQFILVTQSQSGYSRSGLLMIYYVWRN